MSAASSSDAIETPELDAGRGSLLEGVAEQGGYAFVGMEALAAGGDVRAAEAAREMAWEQLHSGPLDSVLPIWRDAYSMACLHVAKLHYASGDFVPAIRAVDMGLLMGGSGLRSDLKLAIRKTSKKLHCIALESSDQSAQNVHNVVVSEEVNMAEIPRILPAKSLCCKLIERRTVLSLERFIQEHFNISETPIILRGCLDQWPAMTKWNDFNYLRRVAGFRTVPVQITKNYPWPDKKQDLIMFSELIERVQSNDPSPSEITYLAQHPLFDQIEELREDIVIPDYCCGIMSTNASFGPAGTVTPLHHYPHHNILAQVVGKKYIRLYPTAISEEFFPHGEVDLENIMELEFEDCILEEGEMLYIPPNWCHYLRSLTTTFSVCFSWNNNNNS